MPSCAPESATQGLRLTGLPSMRLPWRFSVGQALQEALALPDALWRTHFNQGRHDGGWQALALNAVPHAALDVMPQDAPPDRHAPCEALQQSPALTHLLNQLAFPWKSVRLMRLLPGSEIMEHTDPGASAAHGEARLHIPLLTDEQVFFHINGQRLPMRAGECWYTDVSLPHRVRNRSHQARIHLVADALVDDRLAQAFTAGDAGDPMTDTQDPWAAFQRFQQAVFTNPALADELAACPNLHQLSACSVALGQRMGFAFEASDVESALKAGQRSWRQQWVL